MSHQLGGTCVKNGISNTPFVYSQGARDIAQRYNVNRWSCLVHMLPLSVAEALVFVILFFAYADNNSEWLCFLATFLNHRKYGVTVGFAR